jgi:hypothetical protein
VVLDPKGKDVISTGFYDQVGNGKVTGRASQSMEIKNPI